MLHISGDRGSGKTAALIGAFKVDGDGILVLLNQRAVAYCLSRQADPWELRDRIVAAGDVERAIRGRPNARLYVDEIAMITLPEWARSMVVAFTS